MSKLNEHLTAGLRNNQTGRVAWGALLTVLSFVRDERRERKTPKLAGRFTLEPGRQVTVTTWKPEDAPPEDYLVPEVLDDDDVIGDVPERRSRFRIKVLRRKRAKSPVAEADSGDDARK